MPIDQLSDCGSAVTYELRDLLDGDSGVREYRDERVPLLSWGPVPRVDARDQGERATKIATDVRGIHRNSRLLTYAGWGHTAYGRRGHEPPAERSEALD